MDPVTGLSVNRVFGAVVGIVIDNNDPEKLYRVKVKFPWVSESSSKMSNAPDQQDFPSNWARVATLMAGPGRGAYWLPEVNDEVLVVFEHGDVRRPVVIGALWNNVDKPPHDGGGGKNTFRTLFSRSGHVLQFMDDSDNKAERIVLQTKVADGDAAKGPKDRTGHFIVIDHSQGAESIEISDGAQKVSVLVDSTNKKVVITSKEGDIELSAPQGTVKIACNKLQIESKTTGDITTQSALKIKSNATANLESASAMTVKGSVVKIN